MGSQGQTHAPNAMFANVKIHVQDFFHQLYPRLTAIVLQLNMIPLCHQAPPGTESPPGELMDRRCFKTGRAYFVGQTIWAGARSVQHWRSRCEGPRLRGKRECPNQAFLRIHSGRPHITESSLRIHPGRRYRGGAKQRLTEEGRVRAS